MAFPLRAGVAGSIATLLEMLVVLIIIVFLANRFLQVHFRQTPLPEAGGERVSGNGSYSSALQEAHQAVDQTRREQQRRSQALDDALDAR